jgi:hypothetical protein
VSIAIVTSPENAISTLSDLVDEVRDELDDDAFSADKIYKAIARAEAVFNRTLRCPKMETTYQFTTSTEETELPTDFLQMRTAYVEDSPDNPLNAMSPASLRSLYRGVTGIPEAFAVENRRFVMAPIGEATFLRPSTIAAKRTDGVAGRLSLVVSRRFGARGVNALQAAALPAGSGTEW